MSKYYVYKINSSFIAERLFGLSFNTYEEAEKEAIKLIELSGGKYSFFASI